MKFQFTVDAPAYTVNGVPLLPGVDWLSVELDAGATPVDEATLTVAATGVTVNSYIVGGVSANPPAGVDADEISEMEFFVVNFVPGVDQFVIRLRSLDGPIAGKFNVYYGIGS